MGKNSKNILIWFLLIGIVSLATSSFVDKANKTVNQELTYSAFIKAIQHGDVRTVYLSNYSKSIQGRLKNNKEFNTLAPNEDIALIERLLSNNVDIIVKRESEYGWQSFIFQIINLFPVLILIGMMIYSLRLNSSGKSGIGSGPFGFGKSKAKIFKPNKTNVTFKDVAGIDEAKQDLEEVVEFLKSPERFSRLGGKIPRGVLLVGDPGNGKTLLARAVAGEAQVPFFSISGSDFVEVFVGVGASRVREMFENAKKNAPCIVFIDEIDAVGRRRDNSFRGGNDEREQTLNQLLVEMDGFEENQGIIVLAATNRDDILDPALMRPGRFDRKVVVPYPDMSGREKILEVHSRNVPLGEDVNLKTLAKGTPGFSGAQLANLVNEAALFAARQNKLVVNFHDFEMARDKVLMGAERKSLAMTERERKMTAYHEAGHAMIAILCPGSNPIIHKATIVPRGRALGMVMRLPDNDKISYSKIELINDIKIAMGGRVAEELFFGEENVTTGASNDIEKAMQTAKTMMIKCGMSDKLGFQAFFTSKYYGDESDKVSQRTAEIIDREVEDLMKRLYEEVKTMMWANKERLERIGNELMERETLSGSEVKALFDGTYTPPQEVENTHDTLSEFALGGLPNTADEPTTPESGSGTEKKLSETEEEQA